MMESAVSTEREPWIETREGGWFFANAVLVAPELVILFPLLAGALVSFLAPGREPSPFLDTIPFVASKALPILGWLVVIPIFTSVKAIRLTTRRIPRIVLMGFLLLHLAFLTYTVRGWLS